MYYDEDDGTRVYTLKVRWGARMHAGTCSRQWLGGHAGRCLRGLGLGFAVCT